MSDSESDSDNSRSSESSVEAPAFLSKPIGLQLRKEKAKGQDSKPAEKKVSLLSIDEQIALLQKSVKSGDGSSSGSESESESDYDSEEDGYDSENSDACRFERDEDGNIVRIVSSIQDKERIAPLSAEFLPAARCNTSNYVEGGTGKTRKRAIRFVDEGPTPEQIAISGMEKTVREMLANYAPASLDKKPFFCRVCSHQAGSMEDLEAHKLTEFHAIAVKVERTRSFCKHCEKQFTSPDQLKGHMDGKAHKEKVANLAKRKRFNYNAPH